MHFAQVSERVYEEVRELLTSALKLRRHYMDMSTQEFCHTTSCLLDHKLPPSSEFCVPACMEGAKVTAAGDVMSCESDLSVQGVQFVCV